MIRSDREFRFGDGPPFRSLGEMDIPITAPNGGTIDNANRLLVFRVGVVEALVLMLTPQKAPTNMKGRMDSP